MGGVAISMFFLLFWCIFPYVSLNLVCSADENWGTAIRKLNGISSALVLSDFLEKRYSLG